MSGTDPGYLPESMMELAVAIINGSPIHPKSPVLARRPQHLSSLPHHCYPVKSSASAIILLSILYLFASKPGKICNRNSIDSFSYFFVLLYLR